MQPAQGGTSAAELSFPGLAAVDGVQDDTIIAGGPAFFFVHELKCPNGGIFGKRSNCTERRGHENPE